MQDVFYNTLLIVLSSTIAASVAAALKWVFMVAIPVAGPKLSKIYEWFGPKYNKAAIKYVSTYSEKTSYWCPAPGDECNDILITAIIEYLVTRTSPTAALYNLGSGDLVSYNTTRDYEQSRVLGRTPIGQIVYNGYMIEYSKHTKIEQNNQKVQTIEITIMSTKSVNDINTFISACYKEYVRVHYSDRDELHRYMYKQIASSTGVMFKKYIINNKTTIDDVFFPEKQKLLEMVNKLNDGELLKLSILLHGLPGCGKTSIIKALAHLTSRNIVEVKLSFMKDDAALLDVFHNTMLSYCKNSYDDKDVKSDYIALNKRIYILEDIDAESTIIHKRSDVDKSTTMNIEESEDDSSEDIIPVNSGTLVNKKKKTKSSKITLSGVLNTFDGVLELNGAIVVMTTNHVNKLDPALTRPGRITMNIEMCKITTVLANSMIRKYFPGWTDIVEYATIVRDSVFTPAELEGLCTSASTMEELKELIMKHQYIIND